MRINAGRNTLTATSRPRMRISGLGLTCPTGQTPTNMYDGSVKCCGGPTAESDPCSYVNSPQYIATQKQVQDNAIAGDAGNQSATLVAIAMYPNNVQKSAIQCWTNPGQSFVDDMGIPVKCPSPGTQNLSGGYTSIYTIPQLAAMLAPTETPAVETPINITNSGQSGNTLNNTAPPSTQVNPVPPQSNALSNSAGQTNTIGTPTKQQINNANTLTPNNGTTTLGTPDLSTATSWIEDNWVLLAAGVAALMILPGLMGGRR